jgi:integrase
VEEFKKVEKNLFCRTAKLQDGTYSKTFHAVFVDKLHHKQRSFTLGGDLNIAKARKGELLRKSYALFDFDKEKQEQKKEQFTFGKWTDKVLSLMPAKQHHAMEYLSRPLRRFFKEMPLEQITSMRIQEYVKKRQNDNATSCGKARAIPKKISAGTRGQELGLLVFILRAAEREGLLSKLPHVVFEKVEHRSRVLSDVEYKALLEAAEPLWLKRVIVVAYETSLTIGDLLDLTWDQIAGGMIKISRAKTKCRQVVPISKEVEAILAEIRAEPTNIQRLVFTNNGRGITYSLVNHYWGLAKARASIEDLHIHDLRHSAITRWAAWGLPVEIAMVASGHKVTSLGVHGIYTNLSDSDVLAAFRRMWKRQEEERPVVVEETA